MTFQQPARHDGLVSVVMIFLDPGTYLCEAIESVEAQTYEQWELILVDDGSTDGSSEVARRAAQRRPDRVRYVTHPGRANRGMSASRNLGIRSARGPYIAFLDADDTYLPEKLSFQVEILRREPQAAFTYGPCIYWRSWDGDEAHAGRDTLRRMPDALDRMFAPPGLVRLFLDGRAASPATCSVLIRREAVARSGGFEDDFTGMFEDQAFFYKLAARETAFLHARSLDRYRQHPASACFQAEAAGTWRRREPSVQHGEFLIWLAQYLEANELLEPGIDRRLTRALRPYRHPRVNRLIRLSGRARDVLGRRVRGAGQRPASS